MAELATELAVEQPADDVARWYRGWARRFLISHGAAVQAARLTGTSRDESRVADALLRRQETVAERLGTRETMAAAQAEARSATDLAEVWSWAPDRGPQATRCWFPGAASSLTMRYPNASGRDRHWRLACAALLGLAAATLVFAIRRGLTSDILWRWSHAFGAAAGLVWWLWLWPSAFGWLVIFLSLVSAIRSGWRSMPPSDSTVVTVHAAMMKGEG